MATWRKKHCGWRDRERVVALGEQFGPAGPMVLDVLEELAKEQGHERGKVRCGLRSLARGAHLGRGDEAHQQARLILAMAEDLDAVNDLWIGDDAAMTVTLRVSGWRADQDIVRVLDETSAEGIAAAFLRRCLADGERASSEVRTHAASEGVSERTLRRAAQTIGVVARRIGAPGGGNQSMWSLPPKRPETMQPDSPALIGQTLAGTWPDSPPTDGESGQPFRPETLQTANPVSPARQKRVEEKRYREEERASVFGETSPGDSPAAPFLPSTPTAELPSWWPELIEALSVVPEWRTALAQGGDAAVLQLVTTTSGVPWVQIAQDAAVSKLDTSSGSLRTGSPAHALTLKHRSWESRQTAEGRRRRGNAAETDGQVADRHARQEAALRRLSGGALFSSTVAPGDEGGSAA